MKRISQISLVILFFILATLIGISLVLYVGGILSRGSSMRKRVKKHAPENAWKPWYEYNEFYWE